MKITRTALINNNILYMRQHRTAEYIARRTYLYGIPTNWVCMAGRKMYVFEGIPSILVTHWKSCPRRGFGALPCVPRLPVRLIGVGGRHPPALLRQAKHFSVHDLGKFLFCYVEELAADI